MILPLRVLVVLFACLGMVASSVRATNFISGNVTANATWSGTNLLTGTVVIRSNVVVNIDPGARILMNTAAVLRIEGQLLANGTSNAPITFTRSTTTTNWGRLIFVRAAPSALRHCVVEFANSIGDHQNYYYYEIDCDTNSPPRPRTYREAVVALATRLDIEHCTFRNLPYTPTTDLNTGTGDAIAIIADDRDFAGPASANVRYCRFVSIGQGVHSRFSPVLVEYCLFGDKRGDNDDIDLYGESSPPPVIRFNTFLPGHEDKINPTRCSAIIYGNIVNGSDDHGIVLRDKCAPVVFNNLIINCTQAGISVQNQCDALVMNNTIVNSQRGIRLFDHFDRAVAPYCLFRGSGKVTVRNCIIWDCANSLVLTDSTNGHSMATVSFSNIEGGTASASVSANSSLSWQSTIMNLDPQFVSMAATNYRLRASSPCLDAGTNSFPAFPGFSLNQVFDPTNNFDGIPRSLDSNGDGIRGVDMGAYEFLLATADSNSDGIPDGWMQRFGLNAAQIGAGGENPDADLHTTLQEWLADTDPTNALSYFRVETLSNLPPAVVSFLASTNRVYTLMKADDVSEDFEVVSGQASVPGTGGLQTLTDTNAASASFYRVRVNLP